MVLELLIEPVAHAVHAGLERHQHIADGVSDRVHETVLYARKDDHHDA